MDRTDRRGFLWRVAGLGAVAAVPASVAMNVPARHVDAARVRTIHETLRGLADAQAETMATLQRIELLNERGLEALNRVNVSNDSNVALLNGFDSQVGRADG